MVTMLRGDTWLSTVSSSPFQPAMARLCPPSVSLHQQKSFFATIKIKGKHNL